MNSAVPFVSSRLRFHSRLTISTIAVSFFVIIVAVAVADGFRREIRNGLGDYAGDILMCTPEMNWMSPESSVAINQPWLEKARETDGVESITPVIFRGGIIKKDSTICGVMFKGRQSAMGPLEVSVPSALASRLGISDGDRILTYFVGEKTKARSFLVKEIRPTLLDASDKLIVEVPVSDLQRVNGWTPDRVSAFEVRVSPDITDRSALKAKAMELGGIAISLAGDGDDILLARSLPDSFPQIFDWLDLIDANVYAILLLMILVAGFNMISGLLIFLFRNISTIGNLKAMGMDNKGISGVFLRTGARAVAFGMLTGNAAALCLCLIQSSTHLLKLDPASYFISFVPMHVNLAQVLAADAIAFAAIILMLRLPCIFISKVDPAKTVRVK